MLASCILETLRAASMRKRITLASIADKVPLSCIGVVDFAIEASFFMFDSQSSEKEHGYCSLFLTKTSSSRQVISPHDITTVLKERVGLDSACRRSP